MRRLSPLADVLLGRIFHPKVLGEVSISDLTPNQSKAIKTSYIFKDRRHIEKIHLKKRLRRPLRALSQNHPTQWLIATSETD